MFMIKCVGLHIHIQRGNNSVLMYHVNYNLRKSVSKQLSMLNNWRVIYEYVYLFIYLFICLEVRVKSV